MHLTRNAILLLIVLTLPVRANLGDTVAQCTKRYGRPIGFSEASPTNPFGTLVFTATNYTLIIFLLGEKEVGARVSKTDKSAFTDAERETIMDAETSNPPSPWTSTPCSDPTCLQWTRADKATVLYDKAKQVLIITSPEMAQAVHDHPPVSTPVSATNAVPPAKPAGAK